MNEDELILVRNAEEKKIYSKNHVILKEGNYKPRRITDSVILVSETIKTNSATITTQYLPAKHKRTSNEKTLLIGNIHVRILYSSILSRKNI